MRRRAMSGGANWTTGEALSVRSMASSLMIGSPDLGDPVSLLEQRVLSSHNCQPRASNAHRFLATRGSATFKFACKNGTDELARARRGYSAASDINAA
jgi:hypothetical protein